MFTRCIIFGGNGFIGQHYAHFLLSNNIVKHVTLADVASLNIVADIADYIDDHKIDCVTCDVRESIPLAIDQPGELLVCNFAAVHREPGHEANEYYETNIQGAENVCAWASKAKANTLVFLSSISVYGPSEVVKTEASLPLPTTPYGNSKLVAEKIHLAWAAKDSNRKLTIARPGVVFGPGEGGNVSRLVKATTKGYFFYCQNHQTIKAGIYVKELCRMIQWHVDNSVENGVGVFNATMKPAPTLEQYIEAIKAENDLTRPILNVPFWALLAVGLLVTPVAKLFGIKQPFDPIRLKKLIRSNHISAEYLHEHGYVYDFDLTAAMKDWKKGAPHEW